MQHQDPAPAQEAAADPGRVPAPADGAPPPDAAADLAAVQAEAAELKDAWLRARAETENVRRQGAEAVAKASRYAVERFAEDLLPVKDSLEQALAVDATPEQLRAGVELTLKQLASAFARAQVAEVDPQGEKFDPHRHQAVQMVPSDQPAHTVVQVVQKGYLLHDRVLRPAMVTVARGA